MRYPIAIFVLILVFTSLCAGAITEDEAARLDGLYRRKAYNSALEGYLAAWRSDPADALVFERVLSIYVRTGRDETALEFMREALAIPTEKPVLWVSAIRFAERLGWEREERRLSEAALEAYPEDSSLNMLFGEMLFEEEKYEQSADYLRKVKLDYEDLDKAKVLLARCFLGMGRYRKAIGTAALVEEGSVQHPSAQSVIDAAAKGLCSALNRQARELLMSGYPGDAENLLMEVHRLDPHNREAADTYMKILSLPQLVEGAVSVSVNPDSRPPGLPGTRQSRPSRRPPSEFNRWLMLRGEDWSDSPEEKLFALQVRRWRLTDDRMLLELRDTVARGREVIADSGSESIGRMSLDRLLEFPPRIAADLTAFDEGVKAPEWLRPLKRGFTQHLEIRRARIQQICESIEISSGDLQMLAVLIDSWLLENSNLEEALPLARPAEDSETE